MYYSRQMRLPEVGVEGQQLLKDSKCLVVGAGGLGSPALLYLAAAGVGTVGICDGDILDESNLHRQPLYCFEDLGKKKAELAVERIASLNPFIKVACHPFHLTASNALSLFKSYDLILDCTDNFRAKFLINDAAHFTKTAVVRASIYQFEGQLQTYIPEKNAPCLRCLWEETPQEGCVGTCQEVGVLGPVPGYFGTLQAMEAIKYFLKMPTLPSSEILFTDLIHYSKRTLSFPKNKECPLCGDSPSILQLADKLDWEIENKNLHKHSFQWVDIREEEDTHQIPCPGKNVVTMPMSTFDFRKLDPQTSYLLICQRGKRSHSLVRALRVEGLSNVYSLIGGVEDLAKVLLDN